MKFTTIKNFLYNIVEKNIIFNKLNKGKKNIEVKDNQKIPMIKRLKK